MKNNLLIEELMGRRDENRAVLAQRYFKTGKGEYGEGDMFLGLRVPDIRKIVNEYYKTLTVSDINEMLNSQWHEVRIAAVVTMNKQYPKSSQKQQLYELYLSQIGKGINNWDLVDISCPHIVGAYLFDKNRQPLYDLTKGNLWQKRVAIISTFYFLRYDGNPKLGLHKNPASSELFRPAKTDFSVVNVPISTFPPDKIGFSSPETSSGRDEVLRKSSLDTYKLAEILVHEKQDLLQKAIGWALREMGKKDPTALYQFLDKYAATMPRTALRYSLEKLSFQEKDKYMKMKA